jgi:ribosomal protein S18 acetylase RimI-like enzyme
MPIARIENAILRPLRSEDLSAALRLSAQAGWNQTYEDWAMLLDVAPEGCLAIEIDGTLASTTTLLSYGKRLAWIGMVLTYPAYRRQGLARKLFEECLKRADSMGIETLKLDATDQGQPLYEKFGFRREQEIERWARPGDGAGPNVSSVAIDLSFTSIDSHYWPADRSTLLARLASRSLVHTNQDAYLLARPGRLNAYLGPCVSESVENARQLIIKLIKDSSCAWVWDLFPQNRHATELATELGFARQRHLKRMFRGKNSPTNSNAIYAIAGFELG